MTFDFDLQDDIDLMIHYPDADALQPMDADRGRTITLPLWSDVGGNGGGGAGGVDLGGAGGAGVNSYVAPSHPLLMGRQQGTDTSKEKKTLNEVNTS